MHAVIVVDVVLAGSGFLLNAGKPKPHQSVLVERAFFYFFID
jgi:hypothetical protein